MVLVKLQYKKGDKFYLTKDGEQIEVIILKVRQDYYETLELNQITKENHNGDRNDKFFDGLEKINQ